MADDDKMSVQSSSHYHYYTQPGSETKQSIPCTDDVDTLSDQKSLSNSLDVTNSNEGNEIKGEEVVTSSDSRSVGDKSQEDVDVHRRLSIDEESEISSINENYDVSSITSSIEDQLTWRGRLQLYLHSHNFHFIIIGLVVLDAFIVLFELLLDVGAFNNIRCDGETRLEQMEYCHYQQEFRHNCSPPAKLILEGISISPKGSHNPQFYHTCVCGFRVGEKVCIFEQDHAGVNPALVLHYASLTILTVFMIEITLKLVAFRLKYFTHKFEVFDGTVVVISWVLDLASLVREAAFEAAALIIILRLWRVVRIINGAVLSSKTEADAHMHEARKKAKVIVHALHKAQDKLRVLEKENLKLRVQSSLKIKQFDT